VSSGIRRREREHRTDQQMAPVKTRERSSTVSPEIGQEERAY